MVGRGKGARLRGDPRAEREYVVDVERRARGVLENAARSGCTRPTTELSNGFNPVASGVELLRGLTTTPRGGSRLASRRTAVGKDARVR